MAAVAKIDSGLYRNPNRDLYVNIKGTKKPDVDEFSYPKPSWWWTGQPPVQGCPGVGEDGLITSLPLPDVSVNGSRQALMDYFDNTWTLTEVLFSGLQGKDVFKRSPWHQLRHPMIFYYGHVACLYINKFRVAGLLTEGVDEYLEQIMETGVDEMSWDDLSKNEMEWPEVRVVTEYRRKVYGIVKDVILNGEWSFPIKINDPAWAIIMGFEHERIHLETSSVLIRELPVHLVARPAQFPKCHPSAFDGTSSHEIHNELLHVKGATVKLGKPSDWPSFGWDNEYGQRTVEVEAFKATKYLITNGEFLNFVKAGGYTTEHWWTEAGWQWRTFRNVLFPTFWVPDGPIGLHRYKMRVIFEVIDMATSWPVDVNSHEARAYCNWRTAVEGPEHPFRLMTEAEHHCIRDAATKDAARGTSRDFSMVYDGTTMAQGSRHESKHNTQLAWGSECPVDALPAASTGFHDTFGNVWHWTEDTFNPLDGFEVSPLYTDFSTPCFDGLHHMIMGGSFISTGDEASIFSRFHFRPHFNQHAGFRMVSSPSCRATILPRLGTNGASVSKTVEAAKAEPSKQYYETEALANDYMLFHYGARKDVLPWDQGPNTALGFPARTARKVQEWAAKLGLPTTRALDLGCAVGGSSFELAMTYSEVQGLDLSEVFINAALDMKRDGQRTYKRKEEGDIYTELVASVDCLVDRMRVNFAVADATSVSSAEYGEFDAVLLGNLLCRVADPARCLSCMGGPNGVVSKGGLLVVTTPCSWLEEFTPKSRWLGGYLDADGNRVKTVDGVTQCLQDEFELLHREDMPMLIREHARKYQWSMVEVTVWRRMS